MPRPDLLSPVLVLALLLASGPARAGEPWSDRDIALEESFALTLLLDWATTTSMVGYGTEHNRLMPRHPDVATVSGACLLGGALHALVTEVLPSRWRPYWQIPSLAVEVGVVAGNYRALIRAQGRF